MAVVKFGDVVKEVKNKVDRNNNPYEYYVAGDHMDSEDLHIHRKGSFATDDVGPAFIREFLPGQILYGSRRTYLKKIAVADFSGVTANTTFVLETKDENILRQKLIPFIMLSDAFTEWSISKSKGSTNPYVLFSDLADFEFELPSTDEQDKLVELLWSMDETIVSYKEAIHQTDELVKSQFIEMFGDPFENPKGYKKVTIGDVCEFQGGSQPPRKEFVFKPQAGYIRLIQIRDYKTDDYITYAPEKMCRKFCTADDIMIGRYGPPIFQILQGIEGAYNVALMKAIPHGVNKEFLRTYLKRDELLHHLEMFSTRTAGQAGIEMKELRGYPFLLPSEEEQLEYVKFVEQSDKSKFALKQTIKNVEDMSKKVITDTFTLQDRKED